MNLMPASDKLISLHKFFWADNCERLFQKVHCLRASLSGSEQVGTFRETQGVEGLSQVVVHMRHGLGKEEAPWKQGICFTTSVQFCRRSVAKLRKIRASFSIGEVPQILYRSSFQTETIQELTNYKLARQVAAEDCSFEIGIDSVG